MDKCGECPHEIFDVDFGGHKVQMCLATLGDVNVEDCHLTPDLQRIIRAMIAGEWTCESCMIDREPRACYGLPCAEWQPKEER